MNKIPNSKPRLKKPYRKVRLLFCKMMLTALTVIAFGWPAFSAGFQAPITISGTVADAKGETLIGVSVKIKNSSVGTATDQNGKFTNQNV